MISDGHTKIINKKSVVFGGGWVRKRGYKKSDKERTNIIRLTKYYHLSLCARTFISSLVLCFLTKKKSKPNHPLTHIRPLKTYYHMSKARNLE